MSPELRLLHCREFVPMFDVLLPYLAFARATVLSRTDLLARKPRFASSSRYALTHLPIGAPQLTVSNPWAPAAGPGAGAGARSEITPSTDS